MVCADSGLFQTIKKKDTERAVDWRLKTRKVFNMLLSNGFVGVDLRRDENSFISYYLFVRKERLSVEERSNRHG